jgi:hypothetical protein
MTPTNDANPAVCHSLLKQLSVVFENAITRRRDGELHLKDLQS